MTGFRFGVVAPLLADVPTWRDSLRRIADSGYSTLLMPDVPRWQPAPAPTLAVAAAITDLRVGTWVYASPLRTAAQTASEAHSLAQLPRAGSSWASVRDGRGSRRRCGLSAGPTSRRRSG